jgi:acid phosphatase (class A)
MAEVKHLIKNRTAKRFAQAKWDAQHEDLSLSFATLGPDFDLQKLPVTAKLLAGVLNHQGIC